MESFIIVNIARRPIYYFNQNGTQHRIFFTVTPFKVEQYRQIPYISFQFVNSRNWVGDFAYASPKNLSHEMLRMNCVLLLESCLWLIIFSHRSIACTYVIFGDKHLKLHCRWLQLHKRIIYTLLLKNENINNLCLSGVSGVNEWAWTLAKCRKKEIDERSRKV